jgi:acyl carrier protein
VNRDVIERDVAGVLREHILLDSEREIAFDVPLGPGAGLDSLGLMEFLAALEEKFEVDFPDSLWTDRWDFTLGRLVDHLLATRPSTDPGAMSDEDASRPESSVERDPSGRAP